MHRQIVSATGRIEIEIGLITVYLPLSKKAKTKK
jgi:hypothetical protein